jgi:hypothetical protein
MIKGLLIERNHGPTRSLVSLSILSDNEVMNLLRKAAAFFN